MVPPLRIQNVNDRPTRPDGDYVVYWMTAYRRGGWNFALQQAVNWARQLGRPLVVLEALRCGYRWASDRIHQFVVEGMADNGPWFASRGVTYYPYLEPEPGAGAGLLEALAARACVVVTDEFPCFFLPRMVAVAGRRLTVRLQTVDSNGLHPLRATSQVFTMAHSFRRYLQKNLRPHLFEFPQEDPLADGDLPRHAVIPEKIESQWPRADVSPWATRRADWSHWPIDHGVKVSSIRGGARAAEATWKSFLERRLARYDEDRNEPQRDGSSGLSPYLHFGQISAHQLFHDVARQEAWSPANLAARPNGKAHGWWGMNPAAESFLDELITWREIGYNFCAHRADYDHFGSLPNWAQQTLRKHTNDPRDYVYSLEQFDAAQTHDPLWNAAQRQLVREGRMHNYLRMLWGKKILQWTKCPEDALSVMIELNNRYALDGRNPNSYSGIFWVLGRYDRAWGPERSVFGTIRYMSSENTARKVAVREYLRKYSA